MKDYAYSYKKLEVDNETLTKAFFDGLVIGGFAILTLIVLYIIR
jgi:hypothetical protein